MFFLPSALAAEPEPEPGACPDDQPNCAEVVISASRAEQARAEATAPVAVLDRAAIEATGASTLEDALRAVPQLQVTHSHGGAGISMQGLDPEHTLILLDGRPLAGRVQGSVDISRIPVEDIERIEILPGPASALYGSEALGGVVNIITDKAKTAPRVDGNARIGSRELIEARAAFSGGAGPVAGGASVERFGQSGWDDDPSDLGTTGDDDHSWGARGWARLTPSLNWSIDADASYHQRDTTGIESTGGGAVFDRRALEESADGGAGLRFWNGGTHVFRLSAGGSLWRQQYLEDQRESEVQDAYEETWDRRAQGGLSWQWSPDRHLLVVGVDGTLEQLESERLDDGTADRARVGLYAQEDWKILGSPRLSLSPGGRLDLDTQFGVHATPHLALRFDPVQTLSLRLTGGQGYRAPEFKELYLAYDHASYGYTLVGNPELQPETSLGGTLDLEWTLARSLRLGAQGWWNEVENLIEPELLATGDDDTVAEYAYTNVGRAVTRGAMGSLSWVRPGPVAASVDYRFADNRNREDDSPLNGRPVHRFTASLTLRPLRGIELDGSLEWMGPRPYTTDEGTTWSEAYAWIDARVAWTFRPGMEIEAGVQNAADARDDLYLGLPPRSFYAGLRLGGPISSKEAP